VHEAFELTAQQLAVIVTIAGGASNVQAGRALHLSPHTVAAYTSMAMSRLGVSSRAALVARCYVLGLLDVGTWPPQGTIGPLADPGIAQIGPAAHVANRAQPDIYRA